MIRTKPLILLGSYFGLASIEAAVCLAYLLVNPEDQSIQISRLAGIVLAALALLGSVLLTVVALVRKGWADKAARRILPPENRLSLWTWGTGAIFVVTWLIAFFPAYRFGEYGLYFARIQPWLVWVTLVSLQTLLIGYFYRSGFAWTDWKKLIETEKSAFSASLVVMAFFLTFWLAAVLWRVGLTRDVFWDKTGVPLLNLQVVIAGAVSLLFVCAKGFAVSHKRKLPRGKRLDGFIFVLIWVVTAIAWNATPQNFSHFAPGPYPPNNEYYPYSDAMNYDLDAQFPLIGIDRGSNGRSIDKPLYTTFLVFMHAIAGQDINSVVRLQVAALAVFPALLYLLGKILHSRAVGLFAAVLAIFKQINAIRGSLIIWTVSTPKMMMSEFPTAVCLVLLCLLVFLWLRNSRKSLVYAMAAGGVLGLMTMIRNNPWFLLPAVILLAGFAYRRQWKRWLGASGLFIVVLIAAIAPWELRNYQVRGMPFYVISTLQKTIWNNRYLPVIPSPVAVPSQALGQDTPEPGLPVNENGAPTLSGGGNLARYSAVFFFVANNFSHNLIASALTLPTSLVAHDLDHVINGQGSASLWAYGWEGSLTIEAACLLFFELIMIALGIGFCWSRWKVAGLAPLAICLAYMLALGLARTSGGRYITPVDWVTYLYFGLGLVQAGKWVTILRKPSEIITLSTGLPDEGQLQGAGKWKSGLGLALIFLIIGVSIPFSRTFFKNPYPFESKSGAIKKLLQSGLADKLGYQKQDLDSFASDPGSLIAYGRGLYPRFLDYQTDATAKEIYNDLPQTQPHLVFEMITPNAWYTIDLPMDNVPQTFPNAADVMVLGCKAKNYIDSRVVVILGQNPIIYLPSSKKALSCP